MSRPAIVRLLFVLLFVGLWVAAGFGALWAEPGQSSAFQTVPPQPVPTFTRAAPPAPPTQAPDNRGAQPEIATAVAEVTPTSEGVGPTATRSSQSSETLVSPQSSPAVALPSPTTFLPVPSATVSPTAYRIPSPTATTQPAQRGSTQPPQVDGLVAAMIGIGASAAFAAGGLALTRRRRLLLVALFALAGSLATWLYATAAPLAPSGDRAPVVVAPQVNYLTYLPLISKNFTPLATAPLYRFGIARARLPFTDYDPADVASMRFGWYVDWGAGGASLSQYGIEYIPMVRVKQWKLLPDSTWTREPCATCGYVVPYTYTVSLTASQIQAMAASRPRMTWVIGNEPERRDWVGGGQDEIVPELYAQAYHDIRAVIKSADPNAQVAIAGVIEATPLRLEYLNRVWNEYTRLYGGAMPVDVWNVHEFILPEKSCALHPPTECWGAQIPAGLDETTWDPFGMSYSAVDNKNFEIAKGHIVAFRDWMKQHGQQDKPLIITEYGVLMPDWVYPGQFTPEQVRDSFMYPSFDYFRNTKDCTRSAIDECRLVQRWNWYSFDDDSSSFQYGQVRQNFNGYLFNSGLEGDPKGLSTLGTYWRQYVQPLAAEASKPY
ncbi:MAG: hypothetical protein HY782_09300 [Chloroflexi bacterium]|nr:hypothetical protein [Chloroflexota bacterium]